MKTKNKLADEVYGCDFDELEPGEKASITRAYNKQTGTRRVASRGTDIVKATIGRVADNGSKTCILNKGATVEDLIEQSGLTLDEDKETIVAESTGNEVELDDLLVNGETYAISVEIESAEEEEEPKDDKEEDKKVEDSTNLFE